MAGPVDLPKLPEGQESYAGIPKAVFVVSTASNLPSIGIFLNQQIEKFRMILILQFPLNQRCLLAG